MSIVFEFFSHYTSLLTNLLVVMFAHLTSTLHAPSVAHLEEDRTPPALPTGTSTVAVLGTHNSRHRVNTRHFFGYGYV